MSLSVHPLLSPVPGWSVPTVPVSLGGGQVTLAGPAAAPTGLVSAAGAPVGTPMLWAVTIAAVIGLLVLDFLLTRRPHAVSFREAAGWSAFYVALPLAFGAYLWRAYGQQTGVEYLTGYVVEKSLSVDNLFVFMLLLAAFAVPEVLQQRVLLYGIAGALVLRGIFIYLGAQALDRFDWMFLVFGLILAATGVKILRDALSGAQHEVSVDEMRSVRLLRRFFPVTSEYQGTKLSVIDQGRRALTPLALVVFAILATDVVFAVDSVPAVYGITGDPYLVFATNAFALLGLRALYFLLQGAVGRLVHLNYALAAILVFIGAKLALHWGHLKWPSVPEISTLLSLGVIIALLSIAVATSWWVTRNDEAQPERSRVDLPQ